MDNDNKVTMPLKDFLVVYDSSSDYYNALNRIFKICKNNSYIARDKIIDVLEDVRYGEFKNHINELRESDDE